jgi:hypothetical protein
MEREEVGGFIFLHNTKNLLEGLYEFFKFNLCCYNNSYREIATVQVCLSEHLFIIMMKIGSRNYFIKMGIAFWLIFCC